jgi:mannose/fructose-specific phosphotransferase system component IIA
MTFFQTGKVEVLTGVNLPMVLRLACQAEPEETEVAELARWLQAKAQKSVCLAGDLMHSRKCDNACPVPAEPKRRD